MKLVPREPLWLITPVHGTEARFSIYIRSAFLPMTLSKRLNAGHADATDTIRSGRRIFDRIECFKNQLELVVTK